MKFYFLIIWEIFTIKDQSKEEIVLKLQAILRKKKVPYMLNLMKNDNTWEKKKYFGRISSAKSATIN